MPDTLLSTTMAGVTASIVEPMITYPLEYLKTREQLAIRPASLGEKFSIPNYTSVCYRGCSAFIAGNAAKAFVRFQTYNWATKFMSEGGSSSAPQVVVAGMLTGIAESFLVVPFENIKTTMVEASSLGKGRATGALPPAGSSDAQIFHPQDGQKGASEKSRAANHAQKVAQREAVSEHLRKVRPTAVRPEPTKPLLYPVSEYVGFRATVKQMWHQRGFRAFVQGFNPTFIRQVANSSVRFTSYNFLRQMVQPDGGSIGLGLSVGLAGASSFIEAFVTQPIDVVKTRMQSANGIRLYGNAMFCSLRIFLEEGPKKMWAGLLPRWLRIWASGGIMFMVYEQSNRLFTTGIDENPFKWK